MMEQIQTFSAGQKRLMAAPLAGYPGTQLTGTKIVDAIKHADLQAEALIAMQERFGFDVIFPFMDLSVEAEALGLEIEYHDNGSPDVREHPVASTEDLEKFHVPNPAADGRMKVFTDTIRLIKAHTRAAAGTAMGREEITSTKAAAAGTEEVLTAGYVSSPFTLAGLLMGAENIAINTLMEPEFCHACIDFATSCIIPYAKAQQEAGADSVVLLDPTAVLLSPDLYETFVKPYVEKVTEVLDIPVILHVCGQTTPIMKNLASTRVDALSLDSDVNLPEIMPLIPEDMLIIGNINPVGTMLYADAEGVRSETRNLIEKMRRHRNFILSSGCDLPANTPLENIEAFMQAARE